METITSWITRAAAALESLTKRRSTPETPPAAQQSRDFTQERETARTGALSPEDQAWETDRRRRDHAALESDPPPSGSR